MELLKLEQICGMNCHYRFFTIDDFFGALQKNNIVNAEIWTCASHFLLDHCSYQDTQAFRKKAAGYGIKIVCVTPEQNNPKPYNFAAKSNDLMERASSYYKHAICVSEELGSPFVSISSGWAFYSENAEDAWKRSIHMINTLSEFALEHSVTLVMETLLPRESQLVIDIPSQKRMLQAVDSKGLKINLDIGSMAVAGETIQEFFDAFGENIVHCHFVDGEPSGHLAWGDGNRNIEEDLLEFKKNGYTGYYSLELVHSRYFKDPMAADLQNMKRFAPYLINE